MLYKWKNKNKNPTGNFLGYPEMNRQSMLDTGYRILGAGAQGRSREMIWGGRWERDSGLGTHVHPWLIHVNVW